MSKILIDTHILLWYLADDPQLSDRIRRILLGSEYDIMVSAASWWEIAIKISSGKLATNLPESMAEAAFSGISTLPLSAAHFLQVSILPYPDARHRDPFDRLIIAQALAENIPVLTADDKFALYAGLQRLS